MLFVAVAGAVACAAATFTILLPDLLLLLEAVDLDVTADVVADGAGVVDVTVTVEVAVAVNGAMEVDVAVEVAEASCCLCYRHFYIVAWLASVARDSRFGRGRGCGRGWGRGRGRGRDR